jgi:uncharacterized surface protein with fasciclin (FAS1) repeats
VPAFAKAPLAGLIAALALAGCASHKMESGSGAETAAAAPSRPHHATPPEPSVGGAVMDPDATIVANAAKAPNLTTLVQAIKAAGLADTLSGPGPFTVFAPTNAAFGRLAPGTVETLLKPENKASLVKLLDYHVVSGTISAADLRAQIAAGGGTAKLTTIEGDPLTATLTQNVITLTDVNGNKSYIQTGDVRQSNGIVHVVNGVLIPNLA